jgi:TRAP-type C4-dicarboxylate transport system permease large subunit
MLIDTAALSGAILLIIGAATGMAWALEGIPAIVLFGPLLFPIARQVGVHDVHYAMVVILAMGMGLFAPPFGVGYYAACAISRINPDEGMKPIVGYMVALLIGTLIVAAVPWISTGFGERREDRRRIQTSASNIEPAPDTHSAIGCE